MSSWLFSESSGSQTPPVSKRKEGLPMCDVEGKTENSPKDETAGNHQREVVVKKTTASRASLERYKEQLKSVKNKVRRCICITRIHFIREFIHSYCSVFRLD